MEQYVYIITQHRNDNRPGLYNCNSRKVWDKSKLCIIPNFVDTELYNLQGGNVECLNPHFFLPTDSLKLLYAGNIGYAQDWGALICLAERRKGFPLNTFIIGEGVMKPVLEESTSWRLDNVHILPISPEV